MSVEKHSLQLELPSDKKFKRVVIWKSILGLADYGKRKLGDNYGRALANSTLLFILNVSNYMARHGCDRETAMRNVPFEFPDNVKPDRRPPVPLPGVQVLWNEHRNYRRQVEKIKRGIFRQDVDSFKKGMKGKFPFCDSKRIDEYHTRKTKPYDIAWDLVSQKHCLPFRGDKLRKYLTQADKGAKALRVALAEISQALD